MDIADYEFSVSQKNEGKWRLFKWLLLLFYTAFAGAYFAFIYKIGFIPLGALIPLFLWILVFFTWKYTKPDYKYKISEAHISFYKIIGKRQKEILKIKIAEAKYIIPLEQALEEIKAFAPQKTFSALPCHLSTDSYIILYKENGKSCAFMFKATADALKCLRFYNKSTVITPTEV